MKHPPFIKNFLKSRSKSQSPLSNKNKMSSSSPFSRHNKQELSLHLQDIPECLICCDPLRPCDVLVPLHCPTVDCSACLCTDCLQRMHMSASDDYQAASDGSFQVKVKLQCPMCRGKYQVELEHTTATDEEQLEESASGTSRTTTTTTTTTVLTSFQVVEAVVTLRTALYIVQLDGDDSKLSCTDLSKKDAFCKRYSWNHIVDCYAQLSQYHQWLRRPALQSLEDWERLKSILQGHDDFEKDCSSDPLLLHQPRPLMDPTLFLGLDELLTRDEQIFCSQLLVSGNVQLVHQACLILHGMMTSSSTPSSSTTTSRRDSNMYLPRCKNLDTIRKRYPMPMHMPRCVRLADASCLQAVKHFAKNKTNDVTLELKIVRGAAGRVGLRKGDVITHVEGEPIASYDELQTHLEQHDGTGGGILIAVNVTDVAAEQLQKRNANMKKDNVKFEYA